MILINPYTYAAGSGSDADATAFLLASANDGDATISAATHQLFTDLKAAGVYPHLTALYLFVGGNAAKHKWNAVNPLDTDGAHRISSFSGTHDANGFTSSGTNASNLNLIPSSALTLNDTHIAIYSGTAGTGGDTGWDIGATNGAFSQTLMLGVRRGDTFFNYSYNSSSSTSVANTNGLGFYVMSRRANNDLELYKNGASVATNTAANGGVLTSNSLYLGALNIDGSESSAQARNYRSVSVGTSLTDAKVADYHTAITAFHTALSRNV
jgi:hypothetical protein